MNGEKTYYIYKHTAPNGKVYIGQTQQKTPEKRWLHGKGYPNNKHFSSAISKYGWDNFTHEILYSGLTQEEANKKEIELIAEYRSADRNYGYNISFGGNNVGKFSEETRIKMSKSHIGKHLTEEHKKHISESSKLQSEETKKKKSVSHIGLKHTEETKKRMSELQNARTQEEINNIYKYISKRVLCVETGIVYNSTRSAGRILNISASSISRACKDETKTARGYHWRFYTEDNYGEAV